MGFASGAITRLQQLIGDRSHPLIEALLRLDDAIAGASSNSGGSSVFVYREGGVPAGNVYSDFHALYAATLLVAGPKIIAIDNSVVASPTIPAGTYDPSGWTFVTDLIPDNEVTLNLANGVIFSKPFSGVQSLILLSQSAAPVLTVSATSSSFFLANGAEVNSAAGAAPFLDVPLGILYFVLLLTGSSMGDGTNPVVSVQGTFGAFLTVGAALSPNALVGAGSAVAVVVSTSAIASTTQPGLATPLNVQLQTNAAMLGYQPAVPGNWSPVVPEDAATALDELAARAAAGTNVFVVDPSVPASSGNVFKTWAELAPIVEAQHGFVDIELMPNVVIGAPGLNYGDGVRLRGTPLYGPNPVGVLFDDSGFQFNTDGIELHNLQITVRANATAPMDGGTAGYSASLTGTTTVQVDPASLAPFFSLHGGTDPASVQRIILRDQAALLTSFGPHPALECFDGGPGTAALELFAYDQSSIQPNAIRYTATGGLTARQGTGALLDPNQNVPVVAQVMGTYEQGVTSLGPGLVFPIQHNLDSKFVIAQVYDDSFRQVPVGLSPPAVGLAAITLIDEKSLTLDLSGFPAFAGTWTIVVRR